MMMKSDKNKLTETIPSVDFTYQSIREILEKARKVQTQSRTRMSRIYTYPCVSASSAQSAFYRRLSALVRVHPRLISVSLGDRAGKIRGEV
jgi:hypothetical protein